MEVSDRGRRGQGKGRVQRKGEADGWADAEGGTSAWAEGGA